MRLIHRLALLAICALPLLASVQPAAATGFAFNWTGTPATPRPWTPGPQNDWDLLTNDDISTDSAGTVAAQHGSDCSAPPATHTVSMLSDTVFICNNHLMTSEYASSAEAVYGADYFAPAQLVDVSAGTASISFQVSTYRASARDWWDLWLTPMADNLVVPLQPFLPAYQGPPRNSLHIQLDNGVCATAGPQSSFLRITQYDANFTESSLNDATPCVEDFTAPSATVRATFQVDVGSNYLKVFMPGTAAVWKSGALNSPLAATKLVAQWGHHGYNPQKSCNYGLVDCPGTFHWSNFSINPASPFSMLRPAQPHSLHGGQSPTLTLAQPAPANAFLRFAGIGNNLRVSFDGGAYQAAQLQNQKGQGLDGVLHPEAFASYWTPIPAGTTSISVAGDDQSNWPFLSWWVEDASVWSATAPTPAATPTPTPTPTPTLTPTPKPPQSITNQPCTVGGVAGICSGTFTPN